MTYDICENDNTISSFMPESDEFDSVSSLEDYDAVSLIVIILYKYIFITFMKVRSYAWAIFLNLEAYSYNHQGFSATIVESQDACYISKLKFSHLKDQAKEYHSKAEVKISSEKRNNFISVPVEDPSEFGDRLVNFCGDHQIYKIGRNVDESQAVEEDRVLSITFTKCCIFFGYCTSFTFTFPTGTTITFAWLFL